MIFSFKKKQTLIHRENTFPPPFPGPASLHHSKHVFYSLVTTSGYTQSLHWGNRQGRGLGSGHSSFSLLLFPMLQHRSSMGCSPFAAIPASAWAHPWATVLPRKYLLQCGSSMGSSYFGNVCSTMEYLLLQLWCSLCCFSFFCFLLLLSLFHVFYSFLNIFSQRHHQFGWWAQLCPAMSALWTQLEPGHLLASSQRDPLQPPHCQNLATDTQYKIIYRLSGKKKITCSSY